MNCWAAPAMKIPRNNEMFLGEMDHHRFHGIDLDGEAGRV